MRSNEHNLADAFLRKALSNFYLQIVAFPILAMSVAHLFLHVRLPPVVVLCVLAPLATIICLIVVAKRGLEEALTPVDSHVRIVIILFWPLALFALIGRPIALQLEGGLVGFIIATIGYYLLFLIVSALVFAASRPAIQRGRQLWTKQRAARVANRLRKMNDPGIFWGGTQLPFEAVATHFALIGAPGTGKTLLFRLFMQAQLPFITPDGNRRALIYNPKGDFLPLLAAIGVPEDRIRLFTLMDKRSYAWDMACDINTSHAASEFAKILIPRDKHETSPYFTNSAQVLVRYVLEALIQQAPGNWTLRDVVLASVSLESLRTILQTTPQGRDKIASHLEGDPKTVHNLLSTLTTKMEEYSLAAALMHYAYRNGRRLRLSEWKRQPTILVLGRVKSDDTAFRSVYQAFFRQLSDYLVDDSEIDPGNILNERRTWLFVDELPSLGRLGGFDDMLREGRSKGITGFVGIQSLADLRKHYSPDEADAILAQISHKGILRVASPDTAEWAQRLMGTTEREQPDRRPPDTRPTILPTEFLQLPATSFKTGLTGYYTSPHIKGVWKATLTGRFLDRNLQKPAEQHKSDEGLDKEYIKAPDEAQRLLSWDKEDYRRLGIPSPDRSKASIWDVKRSNFEEPSADDPDHLDQ